MTRPEAAPIDADQPKREQEAIERVLAGDRQAFRVLVEAWQGPLLTYVGALCRTVEDREDVAQDAFLTAYERLGSYDADRARFSTWLFRIARNKCLNRLAHRADSTAADPPEVLDGRLPEHHAAGSDLLDLLDRALAALPTEQRVAFVLARFVRLPYEQIALIEGVAPGTVKSRVARARDALRARLPHPSEVFP